MSNLPPGVTLADIDRHFGPPLCEVLDGGRYGDEPCGRAAEDFACAICQTPLCNAHAADGSSSCCRECQTQVDEAMDEFSFVRIEQMLRATRSQIRRWMAGQGQEQPQFLEECAAKVDLIGGLINTLTEIRASEHDDGL